METYIGRVGERLGQIDDEFRVTATSPAAAMTKLLQLADAQWPESDAEYDAACWLESEGGEVIAVKEVRINADGTRSA